MIKFVCTATVLASLLLSGCGTAESEGDENQSAELASGEVQTCQSLLDQNWTAPEAAPAINLDLKTGVAEVSFDGESEPLRLNLVTDTACALLSDIGPMLVNSVTSVTQARVEECVAAVNSLITGIMPTKGELVADPAAMLDFVLAECPAPIVDILKLAGIS
ncbi:hypothetical protein [Nocardioides sp. GCM10030258]|uniref:hypothetical protein n=1 Tax=unclassified Nocardioides TaxID=2615069 RepID=UPI0036177BE0